MADGQVLHGAFKIHEDAGKHFRFVESVLGMDESVTSIAKGIENPGAWFSVSISCDPEWCDFSRIDPEK